MPGMYAVISIPEVRRTRATLRRAEFGFLGVVVYTRVHTPLRWGEPFSAGDFDFSLFDFRPWRTSCWIVGNKISFAGEPAARPVPGRNRRRAHLTSMSPRRAFSLLYREIGAAAKRMSSRRSRSAINPDSGGSRGDRACRSSPNSGLLLSCGAAHEGNARTAP